MTAMNSRNLATLLLLVASALSCRVSEAGYSYSQPGDFVSVDSTNYQVRLTGINNLGQAVGYESSGGSIYFDIVRGSDGTIQTFTAPSGSSRVTTGINDAGQVVIRGSNGTTYVENPDGTYKIVSQVQGNGGVVGTGIGNQGQLVGYYRDASGNLDGFVLNADGTSKTIINPYNPAFTTLFGVNNSGALVGNYFTLTNLTRGFVLRPDGTFRTVDVPGATNTSLSGINDSGVIAGYFTDSQNQAHGFLEQTDGTFTQINVPFANSVRTLVTGINDQGVLSGYWVDTRGTEHGFIATPDAGAVPEPGSALMVGIGLLGIVGFRRYRSASPPAQG